MRAQNALQVQVRHAAYSCGSTTVPVRATPLVVLRGKTVLVFSLFLYQVQVTLS